MMYLFGVWKVVQGNITSTMSTLRYEPIKPQGFYKKIICEIQQSYSVINKT